MEDLGQELAVTKNDIKHLEADISEIKEGMKEGFEKIHTTISAVYDRMDEKFVRKDEFQAQEKKMESISHRVNLVLGSFITLLVTALAEFMVKYFH